MRVYLNHAATAGTRLQSVSDAIQAFLSENRAQSVGRGGDDIEALRAVYEARKTLAGFFRAPDPAHVVFTSGATESMNMAIHGLIRDGCHVLMSSLEHNAAARTLHLLERQGRISVSAIPADRNGCFDPQDIKACIRPNTRLLVMTHASNVLGNILPIAESFAVAKGYGVLTLLDAAQTAGHIETALSGDIDAIAFTGHKGLRGVAGSGGLILNRGVEKQMAVWKAGGTGSRSESLEMPDFLPDMMEPGTPNLLGIAGLRAAVEGIEAAGLNAIRAHERRLSAMFAEGLRQLPAKVYGRYEPQSWTPVVSMNAPGFDAGELAHRLLTEYGIETRSGLHCAPLAHQAIGTYPYGTLRFSFGADNTMEEAAYALKALEETLTLR